MDWVGGVPSVARRSQGRGAVCRPLEATGYMYQQAAAEKATFWGSHDLERPPLRYNGPLQVTTRNQGGKETDDYSCLGFLPGYLERHLVAAGYDAGSTLNLWFAVSWLQSAPERERRTFRVRVNRLPTRVYAVKRATTVGALGLPHENRPAKPNAPADSEEILF